jgi:uncharacterized membrane protein (UPF0182 family)
MDKDNFSLKKRKENKSLKRLSLKRLNLALFSVAVVLGAFYLVNINELTIQGFILQELKSQANNLASERTEIEEKINSAQSFYALSSKVNDLNMVEASEIEYIKAQEQALAKK